MTLSMPEIYCHMCSSSGGIDEMLMHIIQLCNDFNIPMVYGLNRKKMGGILRKKVPVSIVSVFSYDGAEVYSL